MRAKGFTLIEMMVVVSILAILAAVAAPSFRGLMAGQRIKTAAFDLYADLTLARSEAIKRNTSVTLTRNAAGWSSGWTIAATGVADPIKAREVAPSGLSITANAAAVTFNRAGRANVSFAATASDADVSATDRCIRLDLSGRPSTTSGACGS